MRLSRRLTAGSLLLLVAGFASAGSVAFSLKDALGTEHSSAEFSKAKATVFIFVATDCPNSNTYAPMLARLYREYSPRGVAFFNVYSDPSESASTVRKHDADFGRLSRALLDPHQTLARETGARSTPEVVILGPEGQELYRGRVDNRFVESGQDALSADRKRSPGGAGRHFAGQARAASGDPDDRLRDTQESSK